MRTIKLQKNLPRVFLLVLLTGLIRCPLITVFAKAVITDGRLDLYRAWQTIASRENVQTICNSLLLGVCVVLCSTVIAVPTAFLLARTQLAKRVVHELAPRRRAVADQQQILRTEVDRAEHVAEVAPLFHGHLIDENFSSSPRGERDLEQKISVARKGVRLDAAFALAERNELFFRPRARRTGRREIDDCFQEVRLSLRVLTDDDVAVRRERDIQRVVIAKVPQRQRVNSHRRPSALCRRRRPCRPDGSSCRASCRPRR